MKTICMVIFVFNYFIYLFSTTIWLSTQDYLWFVSNENVQGAKQFPFRIVVCYEEEICYHS